MHYSKIVKLWTSLMKVPVLHCAFSVFLIKAMYVPELSIIIPKTVLIFIL
jgi:hypothetical protein